LVTVPYTPQGGTEKSAVSGIPLAMLFFDNGLNNDKVDRQLQDLRFMPEMPVFL